MVKEQKKLKAILKERGISAYRLANDCNIATANICSCLNGKQYIYPKWRNAISEYLGLPEEDIFENEASKMTKVERLLELNRELIELCKEGVINAGSCGDSRVHLAVEAFGELTNNMEVGKEWYSEEYTKYSVEIEGVEFFCLEEREGK